MKPFSSLKTTLFLLLIISQNTNAASMHPITSQGCINPNAYHIPGSPWTASINSDEWIIISSDISSPLTQLSSETVVVRKIEPYFWMRNKLADVTCDYGSGTLILKHTYSKPFQGADFIAADSYIDENNNISSFIPWHGTTSCQTTMANISNSCRWFFYDSDEYDMSI